MPTFNAGRDNFTPAAFTLSSAPNWCLESTATTLTKIVMIGWGGSLTTSTGYSTRWVRPTTAGTGARTAIVIGTDHPNFNSPAGLATSAYATSSPIVPAQAVGDLWTQNWNGQGGVGVIVMPLANPWWVITAVLTGTIECQNYTGADAAGSSYNVTWEE